jgi:methylated-DNA-[protein]-cysteine S-methyltransferase
MMATKKIKPDPTFADWLGDEVKRLPPNDLASALDSAFAAGPSEVERQQAQTALQAALARNLPPKIYYDELPASPLGPIWIASSGAQLIAVEYERSEEDFLAMLGKLLEGRFERSSAKVAWAAHQVLAYINDETEQLDIEVDLSTITPFQRSVLEETAKVPRGQVATYAEIAKRIGNPKAVRAVGQALRRNPIPIVVPCHRVISSDGTLGGYAGHMGDERKTALLQLEGVVFA